MDDKDELIKRFKKQSKDNDGNQQTDSIFGKNDFLREKQKNEKLMVTNNVSVVLLKNLIPAKFA